MIVSVIRREDGRFLIEATPEAGKSFEGIGWGAHFEYESKDYIVHECEPRHKDMKLVYVVSTI